MGAPNFCVRNASEHFIVQYPEDENPFFREDFIDNLKYEINQAFKDCLVDVDWSIDDMERSYPAEQFCLIRSGITGYKQDYAVLLKPVIRSGYYDHAVLDWECVYENPEGDEYEYDLKREEHRGYLYPGILENLEEDLAVDYDNRGLGKIHAPHLLAKLEKKQKALVERLENIFKEHTERYRCVGVASNGEAFYEPVKEN